MMVRHLLLLTLWALTAPFALAVNDREQGAGTGDQKLERETFSVINTYRAAEHLSAFVWSAEIARVARQHSRDMALGKVDFGHDGFGERIQLLRTEFIGLQSRGENVLMTTDPADLAHQAVGRWLKSPRHLHNIRGDFNVSAIGVWVSPGGAYYFTQIFLHVAAGSDNSAE